MAHSSQSFIRALRAHTDPPEPDGPEKISIAENVWADQNIFVPSKDEIIADWMLLKLLKEKGSTGSIPDIRYWALLDEVTHSAPGSPSKAWLMHLMNRIPFAPIVSSTLEALPKAKDELRKAYTDVFSRCVLKLWPLGAHRFNSDVLLECFGAILEIEETFQHDEVLSQVFSVITTSFRNSLDSLTSKKKVYTSFLENYLRKWIDLLQRDDTPSSARKDLNDSLVWAGAEVIFNVDILKTPTDKSLFEALSKTSKSSPSVILSTPKLLSLHIAAIKNHKGILLLQKTEDMLSMGVVFFSEYRALINDLGDFQSAWLTRLKLLSVAQAENLSKAGNSDVKNLLKQDALLASESMAKSEDFNLCDIEVLSLLFRMEYTVVEPLVPSVLMMLLGIPGSRASCVSFLELVLDFYRKTRTVDDYIRVLLHNAFRLSTSSVSDARKTYQQYKKGAILYPRHLAMIAKSAKTFLSSSQTIIVARDIVKSLEATWDGFRDRATSGQLKRDDAHSMAVAFCVQARIAGVVIISLPISSVPSKEQAEIRSVFKEFQDTVVHNMLKKSGKSVRKERQDVEWQLLLSAAFHVQHALFVAKDLQIDLPLDHSISKKLLESYDKQAIVPELRDETLHNLFIHASVGHFSDCEELINSFLSSMSLGLDEILLEFDNPKRFLIDRWLPLLDELATDAQLEELVKILTTVPPRLSEDECLILSQICHSARFWEFHRLRAALEAHLLRDTNSLSGIEAPVPFKLNIQKNPRLGFAYRLLLLFPNEYLTRSSRAEFVKRALIADIGICKSTSALQDFDVLLNLGTVRAFLERNLRYGYVDTTYSQSFLQHLLTTGAQLDREDGLKANTLSLINSHMLGLMKGSEEGKKVVLELIQGHAPSAPKANRWTGIDCFVNVIIRSFSPSQFGEHYLLMIKQLLVQTSRILSPQVAAFASTGQLDCDVVQLKQALATWCQLLSLSDWLKQGVSLDQLFAERLVELCFRTPILAEFLELSFTMLLGEYLLTPEPKRSSAINFIVAAYVRLVQTKGTPGSCAAQMSKAFKSFTVAEFSHVGHLILEILIDGTKVDELLVILIDLTSLLVSSAPEGTLKATQLLVNQCLDQFTTQKKFQGPTQIRLSVLRLLRDYCSDRPMALRLGDVGSIFSYLSGSVTGQNIHSKSSRETFREIVSVVGALIRLRRDLIVMILPHLGLILRQLVLCLRAPRPFLGSKQTALVMDSMPVWISPTHPLGIEEAKLLSRLLVSITTKTVPRIHTTPASKQNTKAESLTKPFSKHASFVLLAYIEAMNDPLCVVSPGIRKELQPGLFALCDMISDHSRDSLMVSALDAGGKTTLKLLWREYEKQKYVGKG